MDFKLEREFSKAEIFQEVDALKKQIDDARPLPKDIEDRVMQKLRLEWNYNSNAIEGNKLNYGETTALLMHGITAKGKPLKDHLDIQGHNDAINFLQAIIKEDRPFTEADIRQLHEITLVESYTVKAQTDDGKSTTKQIKLGIYKTSPNHVKTITGEIHYYATPDETPAKMQELMEWYSEISINNTVHPVVVAALFHHRFAEIHPFDDGNGRLARMLMNLILMKNGYPPVVIKMDDRQNYYSLLSKADVGDSYPFIEYIAERLQSSLHIYIKGIKGEDIDEDEDVDKEITLLKIQLGDGVVAKEKKSTKTVRNVFLENIVPLSLKIQAKTDSLKDYFFGSRSWMRFYFTKGSSPSIDIEYIGSQNLSDYDKYFSDSEKDITRVDLEFSFKEYKNPNNNFNIEIVLGIVFDDFYYKFYLGHELILTKLFHEKISPSERFKLISLIVQDFRDQLNYQLKNPKSN